MNCFSGSHVSDVWIWKRGIHYEPARSLSCSMWGYLYAGFLQIVLHHTVHACAPFSCYCDPISSQKKTCQERDIRPLSLLPVTKNIQKQTSVVTEPCTTNSDLPVTTLPHKRHIQMPPEILSGKSKAHMPTWLGYSSHQTLHHVDLLWPENPLLSLIYNTLFWLNFFKGS